MTLNEIAHLCKLSYEDHPAFVDVGDLRLGVFEPVEPDGSVVVVFRGSDNAQNWLRDLEAIPCLTKSGLYAHHGFVSAMDDLFEAVMERIENETRPVVFAGHSLGGAIAALFAQYAGKQAATFGCPRVWCVMGEIPALNHVRVVCCDDPVPMMPRMMFRHDLTEFVVALEDDDLIPVDPADHFITHYIERLERSEQKWTLTTLSRPP